MADSEEQEFDQALEEHEKEQRAAEEEEERMDIEFTQPQRALKRYSAGTPQWYDNQYTVQRMRRQRSDEYKAWQGGNWEEKKDMYNEQRRARRQEALKEMKAQGLPVTENKDGLLTMKVGRPCVPPQASLVPLSMIKPMDLNSMALLGDPDLLNNIKDYIDVPAKADTVFDLQGYFGLKQILIPKNVLKWSMFERSSWDALTVKTRNAYVNGARLAMNNAVVNYIKGNEELAKTLFYFNPQEDAAFEKMALKKGDEEEEEEAMEQKVIPASGRQRVGKEKSNNFTKNPLRIVQFMLEVNMDPWKVVLGTCETSLANARASALGGCTYAYLRFLYNEGKYTSELFKKVLYWSFIFARYTTVARKETQERHSSQLTSEEKIKNTEPWDKWVSKVRWFLDRYFIIGKDDSVEIRTKERGYVPYFDLKPEGHVIAHSMRTKKTTLDDGSKHEFEPELLPWWKPDYNDKRRVENTDDRPNLRELRDCAMLAVYAFLAPIRLDWATVTLMNSKELEDYKEKKAEAERAEVVAGEVVKKKRGPRNKNILEVDDITNPTKIVRAYFGQMKNIKSFSEKPVPKDMDRGLKESEGNPKHPLLARNIVLAFLKERARLKFSSSCLFPYNTEKSDELRINDEGESICFENNSFGERLAMISHLLTEKNFTETLMRRSYIAWFWKQAGNDPLNEQHWKRLLPNVHQTSKNANLGYIKEYNEELQKELDKYKKTNGSNIIPPETINRIRLELQNRVLEREGMLETAKNFNPEEDKDDQVMRKKALEDLKDAIKEQAVAKKEIIEDKKKIQEVIQLRQSNRLQQKKAAVPPPAPALAPKGARKGEKKK